MPKPETIKQLIGQDVTVHCVGGGRTRATCSTPTAAASGWWRATRTGSSPSAPVAQLARRREAERTPRRTRRLEGWSERVPR